MSNEREPWGFWRLVGAVAIGMLLAQVVSGAVGWMLLKSAAPTAQSPAIEERERLRGDVSRP